MLQAHAGYWSEIHAVYLNIWELSGKLDFFLCEKCGVFICPQVQVMFKRDQSHKVHEHGNDSNDLDMPQFDADGNKIYIIWNYKRNNDK